MLSVCHSLAQLRDCTIKLAEGGMAQETSEMPAYAHSVMSAIPSEEINSMVQDVKSLSEEMLKVWLAKVPKTALKCCIF